MHFAGNAAMTTRLGFSNRFSRDCSALVHHNAVMRSRRWIEEATDKIIALGK
jgi:hypothetical protein